MAEAPVTTKPHCDMSIEELEAELRQWNAHIRRAPAWSAHTAAAEQFRSDCETWLRRRRAELQEKAYG
ncbi:hypothetical protein LAC81_07505 [Ensifer adhaerens]|uniref:hypothetical protein n=1 Tax=Ensifer adhaerens TaxID=106592 RepID=UPI001CBDEFE5|nr:hypothetical protein [Ensifer adhaerens]MBZ7921624.1 hypothetical protein [Ensifer adhaerens]UAX94043.1 hypothetical protein LAC78_07500 [Ensifer adhaerens]UAY01677.1 hypothetical protein LAC80_07505 [Ensifer adhaerens]UAY09061.1 hypothetical protein LAC81_07505 [Ensifer adhaerens]